MANSAAPLPHEWMLVSIMGFLVSTMLIYPEWSATWGFTFAVFFAIMFIASVISMSNAGLSEEELVELAVHHPRVRRGEHRRPKESK